MKSCRFCAEEIAEDALICKHCGGDQNQLDSSQKAAVRKYMLQLIAIPGAVAATLSFMAGLAINQGAVKTAAADASSAASAAYGTAFSEANKKVTEFVSQAAVAASDATKARDEANRLKGRLETATIAAEAIQVTSDVAESVTSALKNDTEFVETLKLWPEGGYCIFANEGCPGGFTRKEGYLKALFQVRGDARYVQDKEFGDSYIGAHGRQDRNPNAEDWHGEIRLVVCCK